MTMLASGTGRRGPLTRLLIGLGASGALIFLAVLTYALWPTKTRAIASFGAGEHEKLIEKGRYLALASDCTACHTARGGKPFAGGLPLASPIGAIYSTNITPDQQTGIGGCTFEPLQGRARRRRHAERGGVDRSAALPPLVAPADQHQRAPLL